VSAIDTNPASASAAPVRESWSEDKYRIAGLETMLTPALLIYMDRVDANIRATIAAAGDNPQRLRPHIKTAKLLRTVRRFFELGIEQCKCATTLELAVACEAGMRDVLVAYPMVGANARRVRELIAHYPSTNISALVDHPVQLMEWGLSTGIFVDVNPGMDRTGIQPGNMGSILEMIHAIVGSGRSFRGLHYYDGHLGSLGFDERRQQALHGYGQLAQLATAVESARIEVGEVITSGTSVFMIATAYDRLAAASFILRVSPGAAVYGDLTAQQQLPATYGYQPAALVATRVVSHPTHDLFTCDAGLKAVAGFAGHPNCAVLGRPEFVPQRISEEHLTLQAPAGTTLPEIGEILYLIPRHAGLTVNNFDHALVVSANGTITLEPVSARGRESPEALGG
jgi:D-serine deaminase-like pyridoxal phosphate-dependent protein